MILKQIFCYATSFCVICIGIIFVLVLFFRVICVGIMLRLKYSKSFPSLFRRQIETNKIGGSQTKTLINYPAALHYYILRQIFQTFKQIQIQISRQIQINTNTRRQPDQNFDRHYWDQLFPDMTQFFVVDKFKYIYWDKIQEVSLIQLDWCTVAWVSGFPDF